MIKIKSVFLLLFLSPLLLISAPSVAQITVFPDCNFLGQPVVLPVGNYSRAELIRRGIGDNAMSSIIVSEGYSATIYENDRFQGRRGIVETLSQCLEQDGFDNKVSSVTVQPVGQATGFTQTGSSDSNLVEVFTDCYYSGRSAALEPGEYSAEALRQRGINDNDISSIRVPKGFEVKMYVNDFYRGRSGAQVADNECLVERFNDVISSLVVSGKALAESAPDTTANSNVAVMVYSECNFQGQSARLGNGDHMAGDLKKLGFPDNSIASFRVPSGVELQVFANDFQRGVSSGAIEDVRCLQGTRFDRQISSVHVKRADTAGISSSAADNSQPTDAVVLYIDCDYRGGSTSLVPGEYRSSDLLKLGFRDNTISSMKIPVGYRVKVFENDFFRGDTLTLTNSDNCLVEEGANDVISSLIVEKMPATQMGTAVLSATEKRKLNAGLDCVGKYVEKGLCTRDAWSVIANFCQLQEVALMSDGYLEEHVNEGNCVTKNWKELSRRISNPEARRP